MEDSVGERNRDADLAYLLLRATLGLNIFLHGLSRLLAGPTSFAHALVAMFQKTALPVWSVYSFGLALPWVEAILGLLLLLGLRTRIALVAGSVLIFVLTFGSTLRQNWSTAGVQLIYAVIYAVLLAFRDRNIYSLDALLNGLSDGETHRSRQN